LYIFIFYCLIRLSHEDTKTLIFYIDVFEELLMQIAMIDDRIVPANELEPVYFDRGTFFGDGVYAGFSHSRNTCGDSPAACPALE
jgi:hypothetical protein